MGDFYFAEVPFSSNKGNGDQQITWDNGMLQVELPGIQPVFRRPFAPKPIQMAVDPRNLDTEVLFAAPSLSDGTPLTPATEEILPLISEGTLGHFQPVESFINPNIQVTRGVSCTHPEFPGMEFRFSGIGVASSKDSQGIRLQPPDYTRTIRRYAQNLGLSLGLATSIPKPDGSVETIDNSAPLGTYNLGTPITDDYSPTGVETVYTKTANTRAVAEKIPHTLVIPEVVAYGSFPKAPKKSGWLVYALPISLHANDVYILSRDIDLFSRRGKNHVFENAVYDLLKRIGEAHRELGQGHGQAHMDNWKYVVRKGSPHIAMTDWGTAFDFSKYPTVRRNNQPSPHEYAMSMDPVKAISHAAGFVFTDTRDSHITEDLLNRIAAIVAYGMAGYIHPTDAQSYIYQSIDVFKMYANWYVASGRYDMKKDTVINFIDMISDFVSTRMMQYPELSSHGKYMDQRKKEPSRRQPLF